MIRLDGSKMSKSKGNLVAPEAIIDTYGADALRLAQLAVKPPEEDVDWEDVGLEGCSRFLRSPVAPRGAGLGPRRSSPRRLPTPMPTRGRTGPTPPDPRRHRRLRALVVQHRRRQVHGLRERALPLRAVRRGPGTAPTIDAAIDTLLVLLAPACPHLAAELWSRRHDGEHIHEQRWPVADERMLVVDSIEIPVQVNGKVKARIEVAADAAPADIEAAALAVSGSSSCWATRHRRRSSPCPDGW